MSEQVSMSAQRSIVICGGAFAGLALAVALRQGLGADTPVIVADPALSHRPSRDPRATAIVAACLKDSTLLTGPAATRGSVLAHLRSASWFHFAGHAAAGLLRLGSGDLSD